MKRAISVSFWAVCLTMIVGSVQAQAPAKIVLVSPTDNATNISVTPKLTWFEDDLADTYTVEVATNNGFSTIVFSESGIADTTKTLVSPLNENESYHWRVRGTNGSGTGEYSDHWSFTTTVTPPAAPTLTAPADNATDVSVTPTFTWSAGSGVNSSYRIDVSTASDFSSFAISDSSSVTTSFTPGSSLSTDTEYFWRVRGKNPGGTSPWSATFSLTTVPPAPSAPSLTAPDDAATGVSTDPSLEWGAVSGADSYTVDLDTDAGFGSPDQTQTSGATTFSPTTLSKGTQYFWRVKASNAGGDSGYSSRSFTTLFDPPGAPTLTSPANSATDIALAPTFMWSAGTGTNDTYRIDVSTASDFTSLVISDSSSTTTSFTPAGPFSTDTEYFWRVRGKSPGGAGPWSSTFSFTTVPLAPGAPTLTAPDDAATGVSVDPSLEWGAVIGADSYTVELDTDAGFGSPDQTQTSGSTTFSPTTLSKGTQYFWRVKASNAGGDSGYSSRSFTTLFDPPGAPTLTSPADNATDIALAPTFTWSAGSGTNSTYRIDVSTASDFSTFVISDSTSVTASFTPGSALATDTEYFWRVRGKNPGGSSPWSATFSFTTVPSPPGQVTLSSPADDAVEVAPKPTFEWVSLPSADTYSIQVSTVANFSSTVVDQGGIGTNSYTLLADLSLSTEYFWRVRASNAGGNGTYSAVWSFTTEVTKQVVLDSPANGATGTSLSPTLAWNAVIGATSYTLQVSKSADMSSPVINAGGLTQTWSGVGPLEKSTIYHWRVRANNAPSDLWSTVWSFVTGTGAPPPVSLLTPADNATGVSAEPTFTWNTAAGAASYRFDLSESASFASFVISQSSLVDTTVAPAVTLDNEKEYFWRVRGTNGQGDGPFSPTFSFTTIAPAPGVPNLTTPADGALAVSITPTFLWDAVTKGLAKTADGNTGADSYDFEVATDGNFASLVVSETGITGTSYDQATLEHGVQYFWRVRGVNTAGPGAWSSVFSFITIGGGAEQVVLASPSDGSTEVDLSPTLQWNSVSGAVTYQVQVSKQANFLTLVLNQPSVAATSLDVTNLDGSTEHYWRVRATNTGAENWSETWSFTTGSGTPDDVTLLLPADGATNVPIDLTLSWNQALKADGYDLQVNTENTFDSPLIDLSGLTQTSIQMTNLVNGQIYYWRVRAINAATEGNWSSVRGFITERGGDTQVQLFSPEGGSTGIPLEVDLVWHPVVGAASYHVQVATSFGFNLPTIVFESSVHPDTVFQLFDLAPDTTYAWRVRASNAGINNWSITGSFVTGKGVPSQVILESPLSDAVEVGLDPELIWTVPPRATSFNLEIALDSEFTTIVASETGLAEVVFQASGLSPVTDYFWHVQGENQDGLGPWSDTRKFTTIGVAAPEAPILIAPLNGAAEIDFRPLFSWNAADGATSYKLEVATNASFSTVAVAVVVAQPFFQAAALSLGQGYFWRVEARNAGGSAVSDVWSFTTVLEDAIEDEELPETFALSQNYPNPFNPSTAIEFAMPRAGHATLVVYNVRGEEVARLVDGFTAVGRHTVQWNAGSLPSGVYLYRFQADGFSDVRKLTLTK